MNRRLLIWTIGGAAVFGAAGALIATSEARRGEVFIAGDRPVTEDQVRQKLQSEGYLNIQIARQRGYFDATGSKGGQTARILVDSQTGRLADEREEDDD
jgi:UDP-N-acetyl-D-mannosaminuronic acid transferase (WecB/TagA/CpsF family)